MTTRSTTEAGSSTTKLAPVTAIWLSAGAISILAPDMVSGSEHEHLPLAALTVWLWAAVATGYVAMTPPTEGWSWVSGVAVVWIATALGAIAAPEMVTGSDPTRIPLAALIAPPVAAIVTGFLALRQATDANR